MKGVFNFIVSPKDGRYDSSKEIDGKTLILNTEMQNHNFVSRVGIIEGLPAYDTMGLSIGDEVIVHHNVFRRFRDIRGKEKNSSSYYEEDLYFVQPDQIFAYKREKEWTPLSGFNFVKPIKDDSFLSNAKEKPLVGVMKHKDPELVSLKRNDLVGFRPSSEYEFIIEGERLYRVPTNSITIKYEYKGNEEEYNPSWAESS
jgi:hypothetical protein